MRHLLRVRFAVLGSRWWLLAIVAVLTLSGGHSLAAQAVSDPTSCGHFETWEDAQAALEDPSTTNPEHLDPDDDGVACESAFGVGDGDIPADQMACSNFANQEAAQAHYDAASASQQAILDPDTDGVACEDAFDVAIDPTSCGHFDTQEDAQAVLDNPDNPNRQNLDGDGDGIACEERFGETGTGDTDGPTTVAALPATGAGETAPTSPLAWLGVAAATLMMAAAAAYRVGVAGRV